jgi:hypothetical protein
MVARTIKYLDLFVDGRGRFTLEKLEATTEKFRNADERSKERDMRCLFL